MTQADSNQDPNTNPLVPTTTESGEDSASNSAWLPHIEPNERWAVGWATAWFFLILLGYYIVRPVRETMGTVGGTVQLSYLFFFTLLAMLVAVPVYSALVARLPRRWLVRVVYHFFAACLFAFFVLMRMESEEVQRWTARAFFVWVSVFGVFSTSVFWSVIADLFTSKQGRRLFGLIAAGGTLGAIAGSLLTSQLASRLSTGTLLLLPIAMIESGLWCGWRLEKQAARAQDRELKQRKKTTDEATGGGLLVGITHVLGSPYLASICLFIFFIQAFGTQLYVEQAEIVKSSIELPEKRTELFAYIDFGAQVLTLLVQVLVSGLVLRRLGVSAALIMLPMVYAVGFIALAISPSLGVLVVTVIAARSAGYGIAVPAREVLFTVVSREDKFKSKNFIDTVVLRGADWASSSIFGFLRVMEFSVMTLNYCALPLVAFWGATAWRLGRRQKKLAEDQRRNA